MSDDIQMIALLTIPKRNMVAGEEYPATRQEAIDDEQLGRGKRVKTDDAEGGTGGKDEKPPKPTGKK